MDTESVRTVFNDRHQGRSLRRARGLIAYPAGTSGLDESSTNSSSNSVRTELRAGVGHPVELAKI